MFGFLILDFGFQIFDFGFLSAAKFLICLARFGCYLISRIGVLLFQAQTEPLSGLQYKNTFGVFSSRVILCCFAILDDLSELLQICGQMFAISAVLGRRFFLLELNGCWVAMQEKQNFTEVSPIQRGATTRNQTYAPRSCMILPFLYILWLGNCSKKSYLMIFCRIYIGVRMEKHMHFFVHLSFYQII